MAYTYNPDSIGTTIAQIRQALTDTGDAPFRLTDAEITALYTQAGTVAGAIQLGRLYLATAAAIHGGESGPARAQTLLAIARAAGGYSPAIEVVYPAALPMDDGYDESDP